MFDRVLEKEISHIKLTALKLCYWNWVTKWIILLTSIFQTITCWLTCSVQVPAVLPSVLMALIFHFYFDFVAQLFQNLWGINSRAHTQTHTYTHTTVHTCTLCTPLGQHSYRHLIMEVPAPSKGFHLWWPGTILWLINSTIDWAKCSP